MPVLKSLLFQSYAQVVNVTSENNYGNDSRLLAVVMQVLEQRDSRDIEDTGYLGSLPKGRRCVAPSHFVQQSAA